MSTIVFSKDTSEVVHKIPAEISPENSERYSKSPIYVGIPPENYQEHFLEII